MSDTTKSTAASWSCTYAARPSAELVDVSTCDAAAARAASMAPAGRFATRSSWRVSRSRVPRTSPPSATTAVVPMMPVPAVGSEKRLLASRTPLTPFNEAAVVPTERRCVEVLRRTGAYEPSAASMTLRTAVVAPAACASYATAMAVSPVAVSLRALALPVKVADTRALEPASRLRRPEEATPASRSSRDVLMPTTATLAPVQEAASTAEMEEGAAAGTGPPTDRARPEPANAAWKRRSMAWSLRARGTRAAASLPSLVPSVMAYSAARVAPPARGARPSARRGAAAAESAGVARKAREVRVRRARAEEVGVRGTIAARDEDLGE
mmetsp:Transcript_8183/g.26138  ORF Transcript_8183/g.26138 Transcript_8183/m.26138 type:complete len:325 (+) Transcript_8183:156-1130(+)